MSSFSQAEFHNALQLSIDTPIPNTGTILSNPEILSLSFQGQKPIKDERWQFFEKISEGKWKEAAHQVFLYQIPIGSLDLEELTQFLIITRLKKDNMLKIAELHPEYKKYVEKIFGSQKLTLKPDISNLEQAKRIVFDQISKKNVTLLSLAHQTGLSLVSLSNFKSGKDIRLSIS
ncbi:MAG: hypothetical protein IPJ69_10910 [Deltaproteobacteria bacterium]|nr:MAG: hypothetical protein IPJ69_10910 [Deltaproteobacteria bacterium]